MANIRAEVYKAISENDLNQVDFSDPFSPETRKAKRNVMAASFITILIWILGLKITGFLGLQTEGGAVGNEIARGLACVVVVYVVIGFILQCYVDVSAWQYARERQLSRPYLALIELFENQISVTAEQVKNAVNPILNASSNPMEVMLSGFAKSIQGQLGQIAERLQALETETKPLLNSWRNTVVTATERLSSRFRVRLLTLWVLDIGVPIAFGILAILASYDALPALLKEWPE